MRHIVPVAAITLALGAAVAHGTSLSLPDGSMSVGPYGSDSPWWDTTSYKRAVTAGTINAQTCLDVRVSGRLSNFQFEEAAYGGAFFEVGLMTDDEYQAMEPYDPETANLDSSTARGSNRGIYLILLESEMYMEDWGGYWPPDGGYYPGQYYLSDDGQDVFFHHFDSDTTVDFSFTLHPSGSAGGTVDATVTVIDGQDTYQWSTTGLPYGRYNPVAYDPYHTGDGSAWAIVEDFSQAHLFVNALGYSDSGTSSFDYSDIQAVVIPEPLTMLGVLLGVSGLGGYIRRRRIV